MDAVDPALVDQATAAINTVDAVGAIRDLWVRWIGHILRAEADIDVNPDLRRASSRTCAPRRTTSTHPRRPADGRQHPHEPNRVTRKAPCCT